MTMPRNGLSAHEQGTPAPVEPPVAPGLLWRLRDGTHITLRPQQEADHSALDDMFDRLSRQARRNRFHGAVNRAPVRWTDATADGATFVIVAENRLQTQVIAEARYHVEAGGSAEFALVVDDRWQRQGLGAHAMRALVNTAVQAGLEWLHGDVLADNRPMLALMRRCHFCCTPDQDDDRMVHAELSLRQGGARAGPGDPSFGPLALKTTHAPGATHWWQPWVTDATEAGHA